MGAYSMAGHDFTAVGHIVEFQETVGLPRRKCFATSSVGNLDRLAVVIRCAYRRTFGNRKHNGGHNIKPRLSSKNYLALG